jgi:hypothetical protein
MPLKGVTQEGQGTTNVGASLTPMLLPKDQVPNPLYLIVLNPMGTRGPESPNYSHLHDNIPFFA